MSSQKIAVVTGSNRGIGYTLVQHLARKYPGIVYLTARNDDMGKKAIEELAKEGLNVNYHQLDIDDINSIKSFANYIKEKHGGLDLLINNAAIAYKVKDTTPFAIQAENTLRVNFTGTLNVSNELFKLLRPHARVVNVSSKAGLLSRLNDVDVKKKLASDNEIEDVVKVADDFVKAAKNGTYERISTSAYGMSKACLNALTEVQQKHLSKDPRPDLIVNSVCPGWTSTGMSSFTGHSTEEAVVTPLHLALLPENVSEPKGEFWSDMKKFDWKTGEFTFK